MWYLGAVSRGGCSVCVVSLLVKMGPQPASDIEKSTIQVMKAGRQCH